MKSLLKPVVAAALVCTAGAASADSISFFDGATEVAILTWESTPVETSFSLQFLTAPDSSAFVNNVEFQGDDGTFTDTDTTALSTAEFCTKPNGCTDAGLQWDWKVSFETSNSNPADRLVIGETATWTIDAPFSSFGAPAQVHINAYLNGESIKLEGCTTDCPVPGPIPEPETYAMMLAGLGVLGYITRRRRAA